MNLGRTRGLNHHGKDGSKPLKMVASMATAIVSKMFFRNQEAAQLKMSEKSSNIKKVHQKVTI